MSVRDVTPNDIATLLNEGALLIDVREESEWENGHIAEARHMPLASVPDFVDELPRDTLIVCTCRSGGRSGRAASFLDEQGFNVANLVGGMLSWQEQGLVMVSDNGQPFVE